MNFTLSDYQDFKDLMRANGDVDTDLFMEVLDSCFDGDSIPACEAIGYWQGAMSESLTHLDDVPTYFSFLMGVLLVLAIAAVYFMVNRIQLKKL